MGYCSYREVNFGGSVASVIWGEQPAIETITRTGISVRDYVVHASHFQCDNRVFRIAHRAGVKKCCGWARNCRKLSKKSAFRRGGLASQCNRIIILHHTTKHAMIVYKT